MKFPFPAIAAYFRERRVVHQPHPDVTEGDVKRIVLRDFPKEQFDSAMGVLQEYAVARRARECPRVQVAALKLAHGDLEALRRHIAVAIRDYRDVLAVAEYPEYTRAGMFSVRKFRRNEQQRIVNSDWDQYQRWLQR